MPSTLHVTRRRALAAVGGAVGLLGVGGAGGYALYDELEADASAPAAVAPTDWPHPSRGSGNARRAPSVNAPDGGVELAWGLAPDGFGEHGWAPPVAANGTVFLAGPFHESSQSIRAFDLTTGRERWRLRTEEGYAEGGTVVAVGDRLVWHRDTRTDGRVVEARAATDGRLLWRRPSKNGFNTRIRPAVEDGRVHLQLSDGEGDAVGATVSLGDGSDRWRAGLGGGRGFAPPAVGDGIAVHGVGGGLVAVDSATGERRWTAEFDPSELRDQTPYLYGHPVVSGDRVFAASYHGELAAFDVEDGARLWHRRLEQFERYAHWYELGAANDGAVFAVAENFRDERKTLHARDAETGETLWTAPSSSDGEGTVSVPALCDGLVYAVHWRGRDVQQPNELVRYDAETGTLEDATELQAYSSAAPIVAGGTVLVPTNRGLEAFR